MVSETMVCRIWGDDYDAIGYVKEEPSKVIVERSARAGGGYIIPGSLSRRLRYDLNDGEKARLTSWLVDQRLQGDNRPTLTEEIVNYAIDRRRTPIYERADRLLRFMSDQSKTAGEPIDFFKYSADEVYDSDNYGHPIYPDLPNNPTFLLAMAWSESTTPDEVGYLLDYLEEEGWARVTHEASSSGRFPRSSMYRVTVKGYERTADLRAGTDPSQVFVAMWFDDSVKAAYEEGIEPAIYDSGYEPKRIDRDPAVDKIDDAIISEIRRSRFVVADFTHGESGARGGVYYEAGFAHGLGIPVIFTCHEGMIDEIHFDTRQYAHIVWDNASDLRTSLRDRILARIGEGPKRFS